VNTWIVNAGSHLVLMFIVSADVPLGWTRLMIRRGAVSIAEITDAPVEEDPAESSLAIDPLQLNDEIDNSLEDLWH
jgi:hypothetical protein